jgi:O-antigen/teichoic acid export membrane protein
MIALLGILGFAVVGKDFIYLWMGNGFEDVYKITLILIIPALIPLIESVTNTILDAMMKRMARSIALLIMCVINVVTSIIFIKCVGYIGAAFGTAISVVIGHGVIINVYLQKKIGLNIIRMFRNIFHGILPAFILTSGVGFFISLIPGKGFVMFLVKVILIVIEYVIIMFAVGMNENERKQLKSMVRRK